MRICVLASGSSGNCIFVESQHTRVLIDAGLSARETAKRLEQIGAPLKSISAICLTHEHSDHIAGLSVLHQKHGIKLFANSGTIEAICRDEKMLKLQWNVFSTGAQFQIGDLSVDSFPVSHDAYEPVGFVVGDGKTMAGIATDIGTPTHLVRERLRPCRAIIIEANHDEYLLSDARRPWVLKQRIAGRQGHLSNRTAARMIAEIASPVLTDIFLCHLSQECNRPELALKEMNGILAKKGLNHILVKLTSADQISDVWSDDPC